MTDKELDALVEEQKQRRRLRQTVELAYGKPGDAAANDYNERIKQMITQYGSRTPPTPATPEAVSRPRRDLFSRLVRALRILMGGDE
jgi:hypothetical protein